MIQGFNSVIKEYVLRAISDDYEEFERIFEDASGWAANRGIKANPENVVEALGQLISEGYARAYTFGTSRSRKPEPAEYSADSVDSLWFYVTPKGKQLARQLQEEWR